MTFTTPRPNNNDLNMNGPNYYWLWTDLGYSQFNGSASTNQTNPFFHLHDYATVYSVGVKPANYGWDSQEPDAWTRRNCTTPDFRPGGPNASIVTILDRSVTIAWDAVEGVEAHGLAVTGYAYQICQGGNCDSDLHIADNTTDGVRNTTLSSNHYQHYHTNTTTPTLPTNTPTPTLPHQHFLPHPCRAPCRPT